MEKMPKAHPKTVAKDQPGPITVGPLQSSFSDDPKRNPENAPEGGTADLPSAVSELTVATTASGPPSSGDSPLRPVPPRKLYQDEVYGTKELSSAAVAVIDTPEFQRLAGVYQLGFTYTVFRGATHRRFDHSVGTYFIIRTLMRRIVQNHARFYPADPEAFCHPGLWLSPRLYLEALATPSQWQRQSSPMGRWRGFVELVSLAGLLHDLGHVPVGHTMEDEFSIFQKHDSLGGSRVFEMLYGPRKPHDSPSVAPATNG